MTAEVRLQLYGSVDHLQLCWQATESILQNIAFGESAEEVRYNLLLAIQEVVTNILRHGYGEDPSDGAGAGWVELRIHHDEERIRFELRDAAPSFDPTVIADMEDPHADGELREGGYGLHIIRQLLDHVEYQREDGQNVLILEKALVPALDHVKS